MQPPCLWENTINRGEGEATNVIVKLNAQHIRGGRKERRRIPWLS